MAISEEDLSKEVVGILDKGGMFPKKLNSIDGTDRPMQKLHTLIDEAIMGCELRISILKKLKESL
jgi:hypothetical protein